MSFFTSKHLPLWAVTFLLFLVQACQVTREDPPKPLDPQTEIAIKWADQTLQVAQHSLGNSPTYTSRSLAYLGLTMYESVVHSSSTHQSLAGQLNGLATLPQPEAGKEYNWALSLNAGQALMLTKLYPQAPIEQSNRIDSLEKAVVAAYASVPKDVADRSVAFGKAIATTIYEWSESDGGHQGYLYGFPDYNLPTTPGSWVPPLIGQSPISRPLHPFWGKNRTFAAANGQLPVPAMLPYSTNSTSAYYAQMKEVYDKNSKLTQEEKQIAAWWGDDPSQTPAPPGHSYNLATIAITTARPDVVKAAETYARVGMATADAFINCWKCKYTYHAERPSGFISANINPGWFPFWPEPPFPAFSSGHATQSAAAATVLTDLYGDKFEFTDDTHTGRPRDADRNISYVARSFNSFWEAAEESAYSRFLGGVHTRQDNETGLAEGKKIGQNINQLRWKK